MVYQKMIQLSQASGFWQRFFETHCQWRNWRRAGCESNLLAS